jgi:hypothetical protein
MTAKTIFEWILVFNFHNYPALKQKKQPFPVASLFSLSHAFVKAQRDSPA